MRHYTLYIKACPGVAVPRHFKVGIAALEHTRTRLATYQNAVGPVWTEQFLRVWIGDENHIREAEKKFKRVFKDRISSAEAGLSEWICDIDITELELFAQELQTDYFIRMTPAPAEFLPLTMPLCEDLEEWYLANPPLDSDSV